LEILDGIKRLWNVFKGEDPIFGPSVGSSYSSRPDRRRTGMIRNDKSIVTSVYNRIAMDVAGVPIKHVMLDEKGRYKEDADSKMNLCLTLKPNLDQQPRIFRQDVCLTMFERGEAAIVPIEWYSSDGLGLDVVDVVDMRVGDITQWYSDKVRVSVWNEAINARQEVIKSKRLIAIAYNPLAPVMNEPNSTMTRLIQKLGFLDTVDEALSSGKLDIIVQLPYVIKTETMRKKAEERREQIEFQLKGSQYGIAYTDGTEKIIQLNRPAENNLLKQIEYLVDMLYSQLGLTPEVMNGTADEATMVNYYARTVYPIVEAIVEAMRASFTYQSTVDKVATIRYFREPFKFIPLSNVAEVADKFIRNKVMAPNEIRDAIGLPPSDDPTADELANPNMPEPTSSESKPLPVSPRRPTNSTKERDSQNGT
jgi:hypothetical protein